MVGHVIEIKTLLSKNMSYCDVNVTLKPGQVKKLQSKNYTTYGTEISLKREKICGGNNKLSLTKTQLGHFNKAIDIFTGSCQRYD